MTKEQALKEIKELKKKKINVIDLLFKSDCVNFVKEEVVKIELEKDDFHYDWRDEVIDYKKSIIMEIGISAGIEVINTESVRLSKYSALSTVTVKRKMPTIHEEQAAADYEFDAEVRFEEEFARSIIKGNKKYDSGNEKKDNAQKLLRLSELSKFGIARADTGAHKRAIVKLLRLPAPDKAVDSTVFVSKIVPNLDDKEMRNLYIENMSVHTNRIYSTDTNALPAPETKKSKDMTDDQDTIRSNGFEDLDNDADNGFESADLKGGIFEFYNSAGCETNIKLNTIVKYILDRSDLYCQAAPIISKFQETLKPVDRSKLTIQLYMLHEKVINFGDVKEGETLTSYLNRIIEADDDKKITEVLKSCYGLITKKVGK